MRPTTVVISLMVLLASAGLTQSRADWSGLAAPGYSYCYCIDPCTESLEQWLLALDGDCSRACDALGEDPFAPCGGGGIAEVSAARDWSVSGKDRSYDISPFIVSMTAGGERTGPTTFLVQGTTSILGTADLEVAVFRYAGDPLAFDGLAPSSVSDLVDEGIIAAGDVLLAKTTPELGGTFSFEIDVTGLADEEIVLMTTGDGDFSSDVPATDPWIAAGLAAILLAAGTATVLRRRRTSLG